VCVFRSIFNHGKSEHSLSLSLSLSLFLSYNNILNVRNNNVWRFIYIYKNKSIKCIIYTIVVCKNEWRFRFSTLSIICYYIEKNEGQFNIKVESIRLNKCNIYNIYIFLNSTCRVLFIIYMYTLRVLKIHSNGIVILYNVIYTSM